jgi:hypothetical protein
MGARYLALGFDLENIEIAEPVAPAAGPTDVLLSEDFESSPHSFQTQQGEWTLRDDIGPGRVYCVDANEFSISAAGEVEWQDYSVAVQAMVLEWPGGSGPAIRVRSDEDNQVAYELELEQGGADFARLSWDPEIHVDSLGSATFPSPLQTNRWYLLQVNASGTGFEVWLDGAMVLEASDSGSPATEGMIEFVAPTGVHVCFDDVLVTNLAPEASATPSPTPACLSLDVCDQFTGTSLGPLWQRTDGTAPVVMDDGSLLISPRSSGDHTWGGSFASVDDPPLRTFAAQVTLLESSISTIAGLSVRLDHDSQTEWNAKFGLLTNGDIFVGSGPVGEPSEVQQSWPGKGIGQPHILRVDWTGQALRFSADGAVLYTLPTSDYGWWAALVAEASDGGNAVAKFDWAGWSYDTLRRQDTGAGAIEIALCAPKGSGIPAGIRVIGRWLGDGDRNGFYIAAAEEMGIAQARVRGWDYEPASDPLPLSNREHSVVCGYDQTWIAWSDANATNPSPGQDIAIEFLRADGTRVLELSFTVGEDSLIFTQLDY